MQKILSSKLSELKKLCAKFDVKKMHVFGSINSENFTEQNDIDFLISFKDDISVKKYIENYFSLYDKLKEIFKRNIDLVTEKSLKNPYFINSVENSKILIYED